MNIWLLGLAGLCTPHLMRIAFLTHEPFYPPSGGGSAEAIYLVDAMIQRGHEVHVFCPAVSNPRAERGRCDVQFHFFSRWEMNRYTVLRTLKYLLYPVHLERMVFAAAKQRAFDLILSQHTISSVAAGRLRRRLGVPVVMNFLDFLTGFMETWSRLVAPPFLLRRVAKFEKSLPSRYLADGVMTVSDPLAHIFAEAGFPIPRIRPIYYGYDAEKFPFRGAQGGSNLSPMERTCQTSEATRDSAPMECHDSSLNPERPEPGRTTAGSPPARSRLVIMHGSFDQHHLGPIARDGIIETHRRQPGMVFKFVGRETPTLRRFLKAVRRAAPDLKAECTGFVPYDRMASHLAEATVGIIPYEESNGTHCAFVAKAVEYLGVGLPVVSTRLKNLAQYFKDEPRMRFSDFSGIDFANQILSWLGDPALGDEAAARRAADRVREHLDWRAICRRAVDFLEKTRNEHR